jgi:hypothetical protein
VAAAVRRGGAVAVEFLFNNYKKINAADNVVVSRVLFLTATATFKGSVLNDQSF